MAGITGLYQGAWFCRVLLRASPPRALQVVSENRVHSEAPLCMGGPGRDCSSPRALTSPLPGSGQKSVLSSLWGARQLSLHMVGTAPASVDALELTDSLSSSTSPIAVRGLPGPTGQPPLPLLLSETHPWWWYLAPCCPQCSSCPPLGFQLVFCFSHELRGCFRTWRFFV